jgi:AcrR family transcriptional regulator
VSEEATWRERKKVATRDAIGAAALRLALRVGPENVRVDDIAAEAGVSPRTFNNYFSSREAAICAANNDRCRALADALRGRPADEPLEESLIAVLTDKHGQGEPDKAGMRLIAATPAMRGEYMRTMVMAEGAVAEVIAERIGVDGTRDPRPRVVAAAFVSALRISMAYWLRDDGDMPFTTFVRDALEFVAPVARQLDPTPIQESPAC